MEKYKRFADPGTSINPFVPVWSNTRSSLPVKALKVLLSPLAFVRLAVLLLTFLWLALADIVGAVIPVGIVRYPVYRILTKIGCTLALGILGVIPTAAEPADHRRLKIPLQKAKGTGVFDAASGCLVLSNYQGFMDVLYLCLQLSPIFVFVDQNGAPTACGVFAALRRSMARAPPAEVGKCHGESLQAIAQRAKSLWSPVVVFPEGARSNGSCVLTWNDATFQGMESLDKPVGAAICGITYSKTGAYTLHHTVGRPLQHLFFLCFQLFHTVQVNWLSAANLAPSLVREGKKMTREEQVVHVRTLLARVVPDAVEVQVGMSTFYDFSDYWDASQGKKGGYTKPAAKPQKKRM